MVSFLEMIGRKFHIHKQQHRTPRHGIPNIQQKVNFSFSPSPLAFSFIPSYCIREELAQYLIHKYIYIHSYIHSSIHSLCLNGYSMIGRMIYNICCRRITSAHSEHPDVLARFLCNRERHLTIDFRFLARYFLRVHRCERISSENFGYKIK